MNPDKPPIPGFAPHGDRYRAHVSLAEEDALDVSGEAKRRGVKVSVVLMERVRAKSKKNRSKE